MILTKTNNSPLWTLLAYLLHPILVPLYCTLYLVYAQSYLFARNTTLANTSLVLNVVVILILFQAFTVFLLYKLKFVSSIQLHTQRERIVPLFVYTVYTFWLWAFVLVKNPANHTKLTITQAELNVLKQHAVYYPSIAIGMGLAFFVTASLTLVLNSFYKISLHMIGAGLMLGLAIVTVVQAQAHPMWVVFAALLVLTTLLTRKVTSTHTPYELYSGLVCGLAVMLIVQFVF